MKQTLKQEKRRIFPQMSHQIMINQQKLHNQTPDPFDVNVEEDKSKITDEELKKIEDRNGF